MTPIVLSVSFPDSTARELHQDFVVFDLVHFVQDN